MKSSPYLLNETIHKHGQKYNFDIEFINIVLNLFSVDDFVGGENSLKDVFFFFIISKVETTIYLTSKKQKTNDVNS